MRYITRTKIWSATLVLGLFTYTATPSVTQAAKPVTIPFEISPGGHIVVPVTIGGSERLSFVVDTAAGSAVIEPDVVERLGLNVSGEKVNVRGEQGDSKQDMLMLDDLRVGNRSRDGIMTVVQDLEPFTGGRFEIDGIVDAKFLRQFDVRFDFKNKEMTLFDIATSDKNCGACPVGATPVSFEVHAQGHMLIPAAIGDTSMMGFLDTGSGHSGINSLAAEALGLNIPKPDSSVGPYGHGFGIEGGPIKTGEVVLQDRAQLAVVDRDDIFEDFGLASKPRMLMGTDLLKGRVLSISYGRNTLFVQ